MSALRALIAMTVPITFPENLMPLYKKYQVDKKENICGFYSA